MFSKYSNRNNILYKFIFFSWQIEDLNWVQRLHLVVNQYNLLPVHEMPFYLENSLKTTNLNKILGIFM